MSLNQDRGERALRLLTLRPNKPKDFCKLQASLFGGAFFMRSRGILCSKIKFCFLPNSELIYACEPVWGGLIVLE